MSTATYSARLRAAADLLDTLTVKPGVGVDVNAHDENIRLHFHTCVEDLVDFARQLDATTAEVTRYHRDLRQLHIYATATFQGFQVRAVVITERPIPGMVIPATGWKFPAAWLVGRFTAQAGVSS